MARSRIESDLWGNRYIAHYDDDGDYIGKSVVRTDLWGNKYLDHYDRDGNEIGSTELHDDD